MSCNDLTVTIADGSTNTNTAASVITVANDTPIIIDVGVVDSIVISNDDSNIVLSDLGPQGPPGPGSAQTFTEIAGENITAYKALVNIGGLIYLANCTNVAHAEKVIGISINSVLSGASVSIQCAGEVDAGSSVFPANALLYIGTSGSIINNMAFGSTWIQNIGNSISNSRAVITIKNAILL